MDKDERERKVSSLHIDEEEEEVRTKDANTV